MIARVWHGITPASRAEDYRRYMLDTAVKELRAVPGNRGVYFLRRIEGDVAHFEFLGTPTTLSVASPVRTTSAPSTTPKTAPTCSNSNPTSPTTKSSSILEA